MIDLGPSSSDDRPWESSVSSLKAWLGMSLDEIREALASQRPMARVAVEALKLDLGHHLQMSLDELIALDKVTLGETVRSRGRSDGWPARMGSLRRRFFAPPLYGQDRCRRCCRLGHTVSECDQDVPTCFNCGEAGHRVFECDQGEVRVAQSEPVYQCKPSERSSGT